jgi:sarcosine oxidase
VKDDYDVIVAGLGAMGSAATYQLSRHGQRVLGLDRFRPPHTLGSAHGLTRIIREAYFEDPRYVPLVQRAYRLWSQLEKASGQKVFLKTGGVMIGPPKSAIVNGAKRSAQKHRLPYRSLSRDQLQEHFPVFAPGKNMIGIWEPRAGILFPERAVQTHLRLAKRNGATLRFHEPVRRWEPTANGVRVFTAKHTYTARRLLLATGAWMTSTVPDLNLPLKVERQVLYWFAPQTGHGTRASQWHPPHCPIYIWEYRRGKYFYGFPDLGDGIKVAMHHQGERTRPDRVRRNVSAREVEAMRRVLRRFLPGANGRLRSATVCLYTNTPDEHFILDFHPAHRQVLLASPCSGHGFKFSSVIGEIAAALLTDQRVSFDLSLFSLKRFLRSSRR